VKHTAEDIYKLLPAIYRIRDAEKGEPLRALVSVLANQARVVEEDIAKLYENWFIETCEEWVVPYIGDLLGVRGLHSVSHPTFSLRARVANTLAYRRRKGTAAMLEQLAHDTTGWPAHAFEFFELLGTTQNYNHIRPANIASPDLRRTDLLELFETPFDRIAHTADVRHISSRRGKHNIPNIGLFLWRLQDYPVSLVDAGVPSTAPAGGYTFSPLGFDIPLFNSPEPELEITHLAEEINVPGQLRRRTLYDELEARRQTITDGRSVHSSYFGDSPPFKVFDQTAPGAAFNEIPPEEILICNLENWQLPPSSKPYNKLPKPKPKPGDPSDRTFNIKVAVDPLLGRIAFAQPPAAGTAVLADYVYGFSGDLGGGPYNRSDSVSAARGDRTITWRVGVSKTPLPGPDQIFSTLTDAVDAWAAQPDGAVGQIDILDSHTYEEDLTGLHQIKIAEGSLLMIVAADLAKDQRLRTAVPTEQRPHVRGNISVFGSASTASAAPGQLMLNGLMIEGDLKVLSGSLGLLRVDHCTIVPGAGSLSVNGTNDELFVRVERTICGTIDLPDSVKQLRVNESIVHGNGPEAIKAKGALADLQASTFFGTIDARTIEASNSIFTDKVTALLRQSGCVRFCFLPEESVTPRRYRCHPDLALQEVKEAAAQAAVRARVKPTFTSIHYPQPGYAQLRLSVPKEIREGADDGGEMGAFHFLMQPQRETNLRASLDEYLRFGLEAGIFYAT
jgi:hypothetical protein